MLIVANDLSSFTLGAGEPFLLQVQFQLADGSPADVSARAFALTFYHADRTNMNQVEGVLDTDASGPFFRFEADGTFSELLYTEGSLLAELSERYLNGRSVIATGNIRVLPTARSVPSLGNGPIGATATRVFIRNGASFGAAPSFTLTLIPFVALGSVTSPAAGLLDFSTPTNSGLLAALIA